MDTPGPSGRIGIADDPNNYAIEDNLAFFIATLNDTSDTRNINGHLAQMWTPILQKGLHEEAKDSLISQYRTPENCKDLRAPKLNPEVANVLDDDSKHLDRIMQAKQDQLGLGITAIGNAMTLMMDNINLFNEGSGSSTMNKIWKHISNSGRILTDLHHMETNTRRYLFENELKNSASFENLDLQNLVRDQNIYGNSLSRIVRRHENSEARLRDEMFGRLGGREFAPSIYGHSFGRGGFGFRRGRNIARRRRGRGGASNQFPYNM